MEKILVSGCLYGWSVRYDGGDIACTDKRFLKWKEEGRLIPVCPEVFGGLPTPRPDAQRVYKQVMTCKGEDVTKAFEAGALEAVRLAIENDVLVCIMKQDSPSCGCHFIYDGTFTDTKIKGQGRTVQLLREAGFPVLDENELEQIEKLLE